MTRISASSTRRAGLLAFALMGCVLATGFFFFHREPLVFDFSTLEPFLAGVTSLFILTCDLISFKIRTDTLRFSLALVGVSSAVMLLSPSWALSAVALAAFLSALTRRERLFRAIYSISSLIASSMVMIYIYTSFMGDFVVQINSPSSFSYAPVVAALVSALPFSVVSFVLAGLFKFVVKNQPVSTFFNLNAAPYFWGAIASALLSSLVVVVLAVVPFLLPITALPGWAVVRISRSTFMARQSEERSAQVAEVMSVLSSKLEPSALLLSFLTLSRKAQAADVALAVYETEDGFLTMEVSEAGVHTGPATEDTLKLLRNCTDTPASAMSFGLLPSGWSSGVKAPLQVDGNCAGLVALGTFNPSAIHSFDLQLWSSLSSALNTAFTQAAFFNQLEAITSSQSEAVLAFDRGGDMTFANPSARRLLNLNSETALPAAHELMARLRYGDETFELSSLVAPSTSRSFNDATLFIGSKEFVVNCTVSPLRPASEGWATFASRGVVMVIEDRTAARAAARALAQSQEQIMALGRALQASLQPPTLPDIPGVSVAARYHAAADGLSIGGDFYDLLNTRDGFFNIIMGDVCGRGPEAAALTALTRHTLRGAVGTDPAPMKALTRLNEALVSAEGSAFCTVAMGRLSKPDGLSRSLEVTLGGHPAPFILRADGSIVEVEATGTLLGAFEDIELTSVTVDLFEGDVAIFYTDGVLEARGPDGSFFDAEGLKELLKKNLNASAEDLASALDEALRFFQGGSLHDDTAFMMLKVDSNAL